MLRRNLRLILTTAGIVGGGVLTFFNLEQLPGFIPFPGSYSLLAVVLGGLLGGLIGFFLFPLATWAEVRLTKTPLLDLMFGAGGLITGLLIATLFSFSITSIPWLGSIIAPLGAVVFGYLGMTLAAKKREELAGALGSLARRRENEEASQGVTGRGAGSSGHAGIAKVLDTSVIIDGRVADIVKTGFLEGPLVIPGFVLEELRHIADSSDVLKRNRGRRGLDILNQIQKQHGVEVQINEEDLGEGEVDSKLLKLAKLLGGKVVTNDYNLNKVAELQGVPVLNINELANSVKPAVLPGEEMAVTVIKEGKEPGQGVAYLDDGTMIVVDGGRRHIGEQIHVLVTSVLQTAAGRMIFARPRGSDRFERQDRERERVAP